MRPPRTCRTDSNELDLFHRSLLMPKTKRYIKNRKGQTTAVVVDIKEFRRIQKELEELESIRAYDAAKASGDEAIPLKQAIKEIERSHK